MGGMAEMSKEANWGLKVGEGYKRMMKKSFRRSR
jgi:hypothetical protein